MIRWWQGDEKIIGWGGVWRKEAKVEAGKRTKCRLCISHLKHLLRKKTLITWNEDGCHVEKLVSREMEFHFEAAVVSAPLVILRFKTIFMCQENFFYYLLAVDGLIMNHVRVVPFQHGTQLYRAGIGIIRDPAIRLR